jgi:DNA polymerase-1
MKKVLLCVDLSYQSYRASAANAKLTSRRIFTGGLYGFFMSFAAAVRETRATHVAICEDSKPYVRSEEYPDYKIFRARTADPVLKENHKVSMEMILDTLYECGINTWSVKGFESDDLIAHAVDIYEHRFDAIYAQSNDSDLYQLFDKENFHLYNDGMMKLWNGKRLAKELGITPQQYMMATALTGTHNDIEGIQGVGIKTALKALADASLMRKYRDSHGHIIDRNLQLIKLPHASFPRGERLPQHDAQQFNSRRLVRSLARYDIDTTSAMVNAFEQLLQYR